MANAKFACTFPPLVVGRVRETYEKFPGGSLYTFSPVRKYDRMCIPFGDCHTCIRRFAMTIILCILH